MPHARPAKNRPASSRPGPGSRVGRVPGPPCCWRPAGASRWWSFLWAGARSRRLRRATRLSSPKSQSSRSGLGAGRRRVGPGRGRPAGAGCRGRERWSWRSGWPSGSRPRRISGSVRCACSSRSSRRRGRCGRGGEGAGGGGWREGEPTVLAWATPWSASSGLEQSHPQSYHRCIYSHFAPTPLHATGLPSPRPDRLWRPPALRQESDRLRPG